MPSGTSVLPAIQAMRGIAALAVLIHHLGQYAGLRFSAGWLLPGSGLLWSGVDVFFVLSGFLMTWSSFEKSDAVRNSVAFLIGRAGRIYPPYWAALILTLVIAHAIPRAMPEEAVCPVLCQVSLMPFSGKPLLGPAWTLSYEVIFYLIFSALLLLPRKTRLFALGGWTLIVLVSGLFLPPSNEPSIVHLALAPLPLEFLMGAWIAIALQGASRFTNLPSLLGAGALMLIGAAYFNLASHGLQGRAAEWLRVGLVGLPAATIVFILASFDVTRSVALSRIFRWAGDRSYSLYLVHWPVVVGTSWIVRQYLGVNVSSALAFVVVGLGVSLGLSAFMYRYIERPSHRLAKTVSQRIHAWPDRY